MAVATGQSQGFSGTIESAIYTSQLEAIVTQLTAINQNLTDFNLSYGAQNSTFNAMFTAAFQTGSHLNLGTISNVLKAVLVEQSAGHAQVQRMANSLTNIGATLTEGASTTGGTIASSLAQLNASASVMISQNSKKTAFEQAATQAALERSNLPGVTVPQADVEQTIRDAVSNASVVSAQTKATGFITSQIDDALGFGSDVISNQISKIPYSQSAALKWNSIHQFLTGATDAPAADKTEALGRDSASVANITALGGTITPMT